ncbi:MAG: SDR family oxidoreductase [Nannocystaceae bacterium]|nr:SDR family oxidoreductase [Nannocystaceae bacterium]
MSRPARPLALITGATRGIGLAAARMLAARYDLVLTARHEESLAVTAEDVQNFGAQEVSTVACDLLDADERHDLIETLTSIDPPVQVLVNNAGRADSAPIVHTDEALWASTIELNLTAPFELARGLAPIMADLGWGRIINIASTAGLKGYRYTTAYSASKAGLIGLTRALAAELARRGVTVNALCPGFTDTQISADAIEVIAARTGRSPEDAKKSLERFSPMGRLVKPSEVAQMIVYLASDAAASITGAALAIDGGEVAL